MFFADSEQEPEADSGPMTDPQTHLDDDPSNAPSTDPDDEA